MVSQSNGRIKPADTGYAPVNGIKVYYEAYGQGKPIILLHGAFMTIDLNWGQLIPELSKTRKVIDMGDSNISKISAPVLIIAGDNLFKIIYSTINFASLN